MAAGTKPEGMNSTPAASNSSATDSTSSAVVPQPIIEATSSSSCWRVAGALGDALGDGGIWGSCSVDVCTANDTADDGQDDAAVSKNTIRRSRAEAKCADDSAARDENIVKLIEKDFPVQIRKIYAAAFTGSDWFAASTGVTIALACSLIPATREPQPRPKMRHKRPRCCRKLKRAA